MFEEIKTIREVNEAIQNRKKLIRDSQKEIKELRIQKGDILVSRRESTKAIIRANTTTS
jgi:uncharacterized coiled-coil DUF342 family protein